ncbi:MAG: hypothetical protein ACRCT1_21670 [Microcoleaceae cyanobacterium]
MAITLAAFHRQKTRSALSLDSPVVARLSIIAEKLGYDQENPSSNYGMKDYNTSLYS